MIYIENIYICMAAPLLIVLLCIPLKDKKNIVFTLCGFSACILSSYVNTFFAYMYGTDILIATVEIAPVIEEIIKLLPVLFYFVIFQPKKENVTLAILVVALSYASFENVCYLVEHGTDNLYNIAIRGFGTGAMHLVCGAIVGYGILFNWGNRLYQAVGCFSVLCIAIVLHGQYNLLMSGGAVAQFIGFSLPLAIITCGHIVKFHTEKTKKKV